MIGTRRVFKQRSGTRVVLILKKHFAVLSSHLLSASAVKQASSPLCSSSTHQPALQQLVQHAALQPYAL
jgi:hypothetical protein